jgi:predicted acyltransferase
VQRAVDLALLKGHLWKRTWDPEGLVGTLSSIATMLTGTLAGLWLQAPILRGRRERGLVFAGILAAGAGLALGRVLPVNKNLWTASYVLLSSGLAALALAATILLTESRPSTRERGFFLTFGRNPLLAFVVSGLLAKTLLLVKTGSPAVSLWRRIYVGGFSWIPNPTLASHLFALAMVLAVWLVVAPFEERGIRWKV